MSIFRTSILLVLFLSCGLLGACSDSIRSEIWELDNLTLIAGHAVTFTGSPEVIETELGPAIQFDGVKDKLLVDYNPIGDSKSFTVELVFKADPAYATNKDPRFFQIQDPTDAAAKRVMMELRLNEANQVYLDGFVKTDNSNLALIDEKLVHSSGVWNHVAITYENDTLTTWFNGRKELQGRVGYNQAILNETGKTSLGARMNDVNYYKGLMKAVRVTRAKLSPDQFFYLDKLASLSSEVHPVSGALQVSQSKDRLKVSLDHSSARANAWCLDVMDAAGKIIFTTRVPAGHSAEIPASCIPLCKGFLMLKARVSDAVFVKKVIW